MNIVSEVYDPNAAAHAEAAVLCSQWSYANPASMVPFKAEDPAAYPLSLLAFQGAAHQPVGHIAIKQYSLQQGLIGAFVVDPKQRGLGVGTCLLEGLLAELPVAFPDMQACVSYVNTNSAGLFTAAGGVVTGTRPEPVATNCKLMVDMTSALIQRRVA